MNYSISARLHGHFCRLDFARQSSETSLERHELTIEEFRSFLPVRDFIHRALYDPALQVDQWKIYPCETVPWTVIKRWFEAGKYVPYAETELFELLLDVKAQVHPWIRLNRVIRDIPSQYILGGHNNPNMRQELIAEMMKRKGKKCSCIRCREVGADP